LGRKDVAEALRARDTCFQLHHQHFADNEKDEVWITEVSRRRWVILTKDTEHHRKRSELEAVIATNAREFALSNASLSGAEMGRIFASMLTSIVRYLDKHDGPFIVRVRRSLELVCIYPK